eukprot:TRINITY_DN26495_c0_g1_i1.p1 TRINITY_DN26495_c0_g1~~TRINITY_DN26495_c0_g1_i1.p1  ORF type:complete len:366 (-),score=31.64 TRINITY_DN26495_c0_g1_i1:134-1231(-)
MLRVNFMDISVRLLGGDELEVDLSQARTIQDVQSCVANELGVRFDTLRILNSSGEVLDANLGDSDDHAVEGPLLVVVSDELEIQLAEAAGVRNFQVLVDQCSEALLTGGQRRVRSSTGVQDLNLMANSLTALPERFGELQTLRHVYLATNKLLTLPDSIGSLANLEFLELRDNLLVTLPSSICHLSKLTYLSVCFNRLSALPADIGNLNRLCRLELKHNELKHLPASFVTLAGLTRLELGENYLSTLPPGFRELRMLSFASLRNNMLTAIPAGVGSLPRLRTLDLEGNCLLALPHDLGWRNRHMLRLSGNRAPPSMLITIGSIRSMAMPPECLDSSWGAVAQKICGCRDLNSMKTLTPPSYEDGA